MKLCEYNIKSGKYRATFIYSIRRDKVQDEYFGLRLHSGLAKWTATARRPPIFVIIRFSARELPVELVTPGSCIRVPHQVSEEMMRPARGDKVGGFQRMLRSGVQCRRARQRSMGSQRSVVICVVSVVVALSTTALLQSALNFRLRILENIQLNLQLSSEMVGLERSGVQRWKIALTIILQ